MSKQDEQRITGEELAEYQSIIKSCLEGDISKRTVSFLRSVLAFSEKKNYLTAKQGIGITNIDEHIKWMDNESMLPSGVGVEWYKD